MCVRFVDYDVDEVNKTKNTRSNKKSTKKSLINRNFVKSFLLIMIFGFNFLLHFDMNCNLIIDLIDCYFLDNFLFYFFLNGLI